LGSLLSTIRSSNRSPLEALTHTVSLVLSGMLSQPQLSVSTPPHHLTALVLGAGLWYLAEEVCLRVEDTDGVYTWGCSIHRLFPPQAYALGLPQIRCCSNRRTVFNMWRHRSNDRNHDVLLAALGGCGITHRMVATPPPRRYAGLQVIQYYIKFPSELERGSILFLWPGFRSMLC
jgi:hypothetical protein